MSGLSLLSSFIFLPARRMRSLPISQMFRYPALQASLFSSVSSGSWTMMKRRFPPSSALICITACAVVAEPEKKSRIRASFELIIFKKNFIKLDGLGKLNSLLPNKSVTSFVPSCDIPIFSGSFELTATRPKLFPAFLISSSFQYRKAGLLMLRNL